MFWFLPTSTKKKTKNPALNNSGRDRDKAEAVSDGVTSVPGEKPEVTSVSKYTWVFFGREDREDFWVFPEECFLQK